MMACQEVMEINPEKMEPNPVKMDSGSEHQNIKEEATAKPSGTMKKQHRGWHLVAG